MSALFSDVHKEWQRRLTCDNFAQVQPLIWVRASARCVVCMYVCMYVCICVSVCVCIYVHTVAHKHIVCTYTHAHASECAHVRVHMYARRQTVTQSDRHARL